MHTCYECKDVVGGLFKIRGYSVHQVLEVASQWSQHGTDGKRFVRLSVRQCTGKTDRDSMVAIDFLYQLEGKDPEHEHQAFFLRYTDLLRRSFGNGLAVWDMSTPVYQVAGTPG